jgi:hypothetical protein
MTALALLLDSCDRVVPLFESRALAERWSAPNALSDWSNRGLAGHLARSAYNLERALAARERIGADVHDAVSYYVATPAEPADSPVGQRIRQLGELEATHGPAELAQSFLDCVSRLRRRQPTIDPASLVVLFGRTLSVHDCAIDCLLELVVHADDLAVSLGLPTPTFAPAALDLVIDTLTRISRHRHGEVALIRTLARSERAPRKGISAF